MECGIRKDGTCDEDAKAHSEIVLNVTEDMRQRVCSEEDLDNLG